MFPIRKVLQGLIVSRRGNVAPLAALMFPMILLMMGGAMDYIQAGRRQEALQGISDAAALAALTPYEMSQTDAKAAANAQALFAGQSGLLSGVGTLTYSTTPCTTNCYYISVTEQTSGTTVTRTSLVTFNTTSSNVFTKILGFGTTIIGGSSTAKNTLSPKTNFYLLIDTSPSMETASSPSGIATLEKYTYYQGGMTGPDGPGPGCEFGCHETNPNAWAVTTGDALYNPASVPCTANSPTNVGTTTEYSSNTSSPYYPFTTSGFAVKGTGLGIPAPAGTANCDKNKTDGCGVATNYSYGAEDNFALSRCLGLTLRIDLVNQAVSAVLSAAPSTASSNNTTYGAALYTFDYNVASQAVGSGTSPQYLHTLWPTAETYASSATAFQTDMQNFSATNGSVKAAMSISPLLVYAENNRTSTQYAGGPANQDYDEDTWTDNALASLNGIMPTPGNGTGAVGDTPEEVLFIITDAVQDYYTSPGSASTTRSYGPLDSTRICETIKARGIRIAVLYLTYNVPDSNPQCSPGSNITASCSWYDMHIEGSPTDQQPGIQTQIQPNAQNCASSGLYTEVNAGGDITSALENLFQLATEIAYLSN